MQTAQSYKHSSKAGFTLIELLVTTALTTIILLTASTILMTFFLSNTRTSIRRQIKAEGARALARIEFIGRGARSCNTTGGGITFVNLDDTQATFLVDGNRNLIMQNKNAGGTVLSTEELLAEYQVGAGQTFTCVPASPTQSKSYADIRFNVVNTATTISESFTTLVVMRNSQ